MKPIRIQRKRTKGWKMPPNTVYVGRGSKWGNRFRVVNEDNANLWIEDTSTKQLVHLLNDDEDPQFAPVKFFRERQLDGLPNLKELRGKNLACWCPLDQPCHADVLLEIANQDDA